MAHNAASNNPIDGPYTFHPDGTLSASTPRSHRDSLASEVARQFVYPEPTEEQRVRIGKVQSAARLMAYEIIKNTAPGTDQADMLKSLRSAVQSAYQNIVHGPL